MYLFLCRTATLDRIPVGDASVQDIIRMTKPASAASSGRRVFDVDRRKVVYWAARWRGKEIYEIAPDEGMNDN